MADETPLTKAWAKIRNTVASTAATYRDEGHTVVEAVADHGTVRDAGEDPVALVLTVPDDIADELEAAVDDGGTYRTSVQYVDVASIRLFVLEVRGDGPVILLAGGIRHDQLTPHAGDPDAAARTVIRRVNGHEAAQFTHERLAPFVADLR